MKIWIVTEYYDWSIGTHVFATQEQAEDKAVKLWGFLIDQAGGEHPDDDEIERYGSEIAAYEEAASNCGADDGVLIQVEAATVRGPK